jgi:glutamate 5-kinase
MKKKLVLKVGTSTLTNSTNKIKRGKIEDIAQQLEALQKEFDLVIVSSGAVAAAKQTIQWGGGSVEDIAQKQALAAIGQPFLMHRYQEVFNDYNLKTAQCLLTYNDVSNAIAQQNILNTLTILWQHQYIPIINENDTVATEEIKFGDNDKLAALVAVMINADLLILASDIDGLYNADPKENRDARLIEKVEDIKLIKNFVATSKSEQGTGGMLSKIMAAEICMEHHINMWIVNGQKESFILNALNGHTKYTSFG